MEQTNILERTAPSNAVNFAESETHLGYALNVALVYQDALTRKWATEVCDQVTRLAGQDAGPLPPVGDQPPERSLCAQGRHPDDNGGRRHFGFNL